MVRVELFYRQGRNERKDRSQAFVRFVSFVVKLAPPA